MEDEFAIAMYSSVSIPEESKCEEDLMFTLNAV